MFPVKYKSKIARTESYPVKAKQISEALAGVSQAEHLTLHFRQPFPPHRFEERWLRTMRVGYYRGTIGISTSNDAIERGGLEPR